MALASGGMVAVSVQLTRLTNNAGVSVQGNARWIDRTGETRLDAAGEHVETDISHTITADCIATHPPADVAREVLLLLLGAAPDAPLVQWSDENRAQASMPVEIAGGEGLGQGRRRRIARAEVMRWRAALAPLAPLALGSCVTTPGCRWRLVVERA